MARQLNKNGFSCDKWLQIRLKRSKDLLNEKIQEHRNGYIKRNVVKSSFYFFDLVKIVQELLISEIKTIFSELSKAIHFEETDIYNIKKNLLHFVEEFYSDALNLSYLVVSVDVIQKNKDKSQKIVFNEIEVLIHNILMSIPDKMNKLEDRETPHITSEASTMSQKKQKVFISHRSTDKEVADMLLDFLVGTGILRDTIFCSSLPGNDINEKITGEVKVAMKDSVVNVAILSRDYYQSAYCLNEAGVIWYMDDIPAIPVALPEINSNNMYGFLSNEYKLRFLDSVNDIAYIYDTVCDALSVSQTKSSVVTCETQKLKKRYQNYLESRAESTNEKPATDILLHITTDDERIVLYYMLSNNTRKVIKGNILDWLRKNEVHDINVDNAFDLLSTLGDGSVSNDTLELDIKTFRKYSAIATTVIEKLKPCLERYIQLSSERFQELWVSDILEEHIRLFIAYISEERVASFGARWMAEGQIESIGEWESRNSLDSELSENYTNCLDFFIQHNLVYESSWTSYGNPREYTLCSSLKELVFNQSEHYSEVLQRVKEAHRWVSPF